VCSSDLPKTPKPLNLLDVTVNNINQLGEAQLVLRSLIEVLPPTYSKQEIYMCSRQVSQLEVGPR
jgi:hypothetical protein